jgi:hypothetical protein
LLIAQALPDIVATTSRRISEPLTHRRKRRRMREHRQEVQRAHAAVGQEREALVNGRADARAASLNDLAVARTASMN